MAALHVNLQYADFKGLFPPRRTQLLYGLDGAGNVNSVGVHGTLATYGLVVGGPFAFISEATLLADYPDAIRVNEVS